MSGRLVRCEGPTVKVPMSPSADIFVDASSALTPTVTSVASTTTTMTSTVTIATAPVASARPTYRVTSAVLPPAPTTDLSKLCADVRAVLLAQGDLKTILHAHTEKLNQCTEFIQSQKAHNVAIENTIASLTSDINAKFDVLTKNYAEVSSKVLSLESSLSTLQTQVNKLQSYGSGSLSASSLAEINTINARVRKLEQEQTSCDMTISGLPEQDGENLPLTVTRIAEVLEVPLSSSDIVSVRRLPTNLPQSQNSGRLSRPRTVLLRLSNFGQKRSLLAARRSKGRLTADEVSSSFPVSLIRLNDFIPRDSWVLLKAARAAARERGYRFAWYSRGTVLVRKEVGTAPIRILSEEDIQTRMH